MRGRRWPPGGPRSRPSPCASDPPSGHVRRDLEPSADDGLDWPSHAADAGGSTRRRAGEGLRGQLRVRPRPPGAVPRRPAVRGRELAAVLRPAARVAPRPNPRRRRRPARTAGDHAAPAAAAPKPASGRRPSATAPCGRGQAADHAGGRSSGAARGAGQRQEPRPGGARHPARRHRPAHPRRRPAHRREHGGQPHRPHRDLDAQHPGAHAGGEPRASSTSTATRTAASKISFTHLVAWAILRALDTFPRLNDAYAELEGQAHRIQRDAGAARHRRGRPEEGRHAHAARPQHQGRGTAGLRAVPEGLRRPGRALAQGHDLARRLHGHDGVADQPRHRRHQRLRAAPHARPGPDRGHRRPRLSGRVPLDGPAHALAARHQQGHDGDLDLRPPHHPGRGVGPLPRAHGGAAARRGRLLRADLRGPQGPAPARASWEIDENPGLFGPAGSKEEVEKQARVLQLINAYRVRGHLVADLDPLDSTRAPHKDLDPATYGLTHLGPRPRVHHQRPGRHRPR